MSWLSYRLQIASLKFSQLPRRELTSGALSFLTVLSPIELREHESAFAREASASWAAFLAERRPMLLPSPCLARSGLPGLWLFPPGTRLVDRQTRNSQVSVSTGNTVEH
jgi:hypothetical protein